ncbi:MAG: hypothetical protein R2764_03200 [Bacteroidales bacterium]
MLKNSRLSSDHPWQAKTGMMKLSLSRTARKAAKRDQPEKPVSIIQARMEEIVEHVYYEIKNSGYEKKLIAGIVLTGGGLN